MTELLVPARFNGPAASGNGGWTAGTLAGLVHDADHAAGWPPVRITLRRPPPLDRPLPVSDGVAADDEGVVAAAELVDGPLREVEAVSQDEAAAATASYAGLRTHPFPTCFACGPDRAEGDGLRIFPGRVADDREGRVRVASTWTPHESHAEDWWFLGSERSERLEGHLYADDHRRASLAVTWASLDCVGGWAGDLEERPMVLGRMTARVDALPVVGERHVVVGGARGGEGRKTFTAAPLYDADGRVVAVAEHVWIAVDPAAFNRLRG
ncbi:hypothetical protein [Nocardioides sp. GXQ0305]|uniref:hypothetical protein n=1 Tax=Nocardioides sp. GXQ0305 TaxID=3423912 RepID=UPI003D7F1284